MKNNETKKTLTLSEIKTMLPTTKGIKRRPTAAALRTDVKLLLNSESGDSVMQIYENGFAVYSNGKYETVIRVEYIGNAGYEFRDDNGRIRRGGEPLDDAPWDVAVFLDGEDRLKAELDKRDSRRLKSITGAGGINDNGEEEDMEFDAGVDVAGEVSDGEYREQFWKTVKALLTEKQAEVAELYFRQGFTQEEVATIIGISQRAVGYHIEGIQKKLEKNRKKFQKYF